ncbi:MAG TPA: malto-oligosyltrehalose synthase [Bryobacteraceae bacterium]|nr:malto-oligosyltrehalose synthase [Bryobacteraceae bacterium]
MNPLRAPLATYRIQLQPAFTFDDAARIAPYLRDLGVSHVYCSPYLQAAPGSTHGYDIVDYQHVNRELGGAEAQQRFVETLRTLGLSQVLDIVPNHMAIVAGNHWWWDVLENGEASRYAPYFDIEWNGPEERYRGKILLPVLGDHFGLILSSGQIQLEYSGGHFMVRYHEHTFPLAPESLAGLLAKAAERAGSSHLGFLADALVRLQQAGEGTWSSRLLRDRNKEAIREQIARLSDERPAVAAQIARVIDEMNHDFDALDQILSSQNYRLSRWRTAESELVYRRFFDINSLVGIRPGNERVFEDIHRLILDWLKQGQVDGLRVDHPDGLRDPGEYFERLGAAAPGLWIVAEKILATNESLNPRWNIAGTTGYDFLNVACGLFVDPSGEAAMNELYRTFANATADFRVVARDSKALILRDLLGSDINRLTAIFLDICEHNRDYRDYTRHEIHEAIRETIASFSVYRTYVSPESGGPTEAEVGYITQAAADAAAARPEIEQRLFTFLADVLLLKVRGEQEQEFVLRFQQVTSAAMAKGVEDTAFYRYARLISLNEVGGDPTRFTVTIDEFHRWCANIHASYPLTMLATSTHDTKRSEDVRIRISMLASQVPLWSETVNRWAAMNAQYKDSDFPDRRTEYFLYQTLVGAWPISFDRLNRYMEKVVRESKDRSSWLKPDAQYEGALRHFCDSILADKDFIADLELFLAQLLGPARTASLALNLLKLTAPGIPDIYQGTELWNLCLVDPDNRAPVDFEPRMKLLAELDALTPEQILARSGEGLPKLWMIRQTLRARREHPETLGPDGGYTPLWPAGPKAAAIVAYQRGEDAVIIAPRLSLATVDGETVLEIPAGKWKNQFTREMLDGGKAEMSALLARFPVALLIREPAG